MFTLAISFDHFQFALIHGSNISGSYVILFFTALDLASITSHIHSWTMFLLCFSLFIPSGVISPLFSSGILGTYQLGSPSFSDLYFCLFILFMGFSRQEYWSGLPFPSPVDHILSSDYIICLEILCLWTGSSWVQGCFFFISVFLGFIPVPGKKQRLTNIYWINEFNHLGTVPS